MVFAEPTSTQNSPHLVNRSFNDDDSDQDYQSRPELQDPLSVAATRIKIKEEPNLMQMDTQLTVLSKYNDEEDIFQNNSIPNDSLFAELSPADPMEGESLLVSENIVINNTSTEFNSESQHSISETPVATSDLVMINIDDFISQTDCHITSQGEIGSENQIELSYKDQNDNDCNQPVKNGVLDAHELQEQVSSNSSATSMTLENSIESACVAGLPVFEKIKIKREAGLKIASSECQLNLTILKGYKTRIGEYYICPRCRGKYVTSDCVREHLSTCEVSSQFRLTNYSSSSSDSEDVDCSKGGTLNVNTSEPDVPDNHHRDEFPRMKDTVSSVFTCDIDNCSKTFSSKQDLTRHRWSHRSESAGQFPCSVCTKEFASQSSLNRHFGRLHRYKDRRKLNADFMPVSTRLRSRAVMTNVPSPGPSDTISEINKSSDPIYQVLTSDPVSISSSYGSDTFSSTPTVNPKSKALDLQSGTTFSCDFCDETFFLKIFLDDHLKTHINDYPFSCNLCYEFFRSQPDLQCHISESHSPSQLTAALGEGDSQSEEDFQPVGHDPLEEDHQPEENCQLEDDHHDQPEEDPFQINMNTLECGEDFPPESEILQPPQSHVAPNYNNNRKVSNVTVLGSGNSNTPTIMRRLIPKNFIASSNPSLLTPVTQTFGCLNCCSAKYHTLEELRIHSVNCIHRIEDYPLDHDYISWSFPCFSCHISFPSQSERIKHCVEVHDLKNCFLINFQPKFKKNSTIRYIKPNIRTSGKVVKVIKRTILDHTDDVFSSKVTTENPKIIRRSIREGNNSKLHRKNLRMSFVNLRELVPHLKNITTSSKVTILTEAKTYIDCLEKCNYRLNRLKCNMTQRKTLLQKRIDLLKSQLGCDQ